ncbi:MAG: efflux RND transporter periplasmic adaptor subunit [Deltaproteobacteria bacterium]|nr:efflux RND transporter periplasmic adaptor subunit [Deltaproteobacteria bacterium]
MMKITRNHFMKTIVFGSVGLLSLTFLGCGDGAETQADTKAESKKIRLVKVSPVNASAPKGSIEYMGVLTAYRKVMLASEAGGTIEKLYFEKGDRVTLLRSARAASVSGSVRQRPRWRLP